MEKHTKRKIKEWRGGHVVQRMDRKNYPAGPSAGSGILRLYEEYLLKAVGKKKKARVIVLGATPELRDLVLKHGHELVTIDISMDAIEKWSNLMKFKNNLNEIIVKCSWLNMPLKGNHFDLIMGDGASNNISPQDHNKFLKEIKRLLRPGGYLLLREGIILPEKEIEPVKKICQDFRKGKMHWMDFYYRLRFYSPIVYKHFNKRSYLTRMGKFHQELDKLYRRKVLTKREYDKLNKWRGSLVHTIFPKNILEKILSKYFKSLLSKQAKDFEFCQTVFRFFFTQNRK